MPFARPKILSSACLQFSACRYDGTRISMSFIDELDPYVDFLRTCPEEEIGMGTPRDTIRLVDTGDGTELVQPKTGEKFTDAMRGFATEFVAQHHGIDGAILKSGSPSCGIAGIKVYQGAQESRSLRREPGLFASKVIHRYGDEIAIEDDGRLRNFDIRHQFLTYIFASAELRTLSASKEFVDFQRRHKMIFMAHNQELARELGRIVGTKMSITEKHDAYRPVFHEVLRNDPKRGSWVNAILHVYGHFKDVVDKPERDAFLNVVEQISDSRLPLSAALVTLRLWSKRFDNAYIEDQAIFEPYPVELLTVRDSGKKISGR